MEYGGLGQVVEIRRVPGASTTPGQFDAEVVIELGRCGRLQLRCTVEEASAFHVGQPMRLTLTPDGRVLSAAAAPPLPGFEQLDTPALVAGASPAPKRSRRPRAESSST